MPALPTASIPCQRECSNSTSITQTRGQVLPRATSAHWAKMTGRANSALKLTIGRYESALHANLSSTCATLGRVVAGPALPRHNEPFARGHPFIRVRFIGPCFTEAGSASIRAPSGEASQLCGMDFQPEQRDLSLVVLRSCPCYTSHLFSY
jgi:hypothetical protein